MSLFRQLLILVSFLFFMIFSINFVSGMTHIQEYLEIESRVHAQNTATSLGLSLRPYLAEHDDALINTTMNSIFDRGYYRDITLFNPAGKVWVELTNPNRVEGVPPWFIELLSLETASAESEINDGWMISGTVRVSINPGVAHYKLYQQAKRSAFSSLLMFGVSVVLLFIVLQWILRPLRDMERLAVDISEGRFETIEKLPSTTEIRNVATAMNMMSAKVNAHVAQLKKYAEDLAAVLKSERNKRLQLEASNEQMKKYAEDLKSTLVSLREARQTQQQTKDDPKSGDDGQ
jgi:methyl-accepting chemotaxis protein